MFLIISPGHQRSITAPEKSQEEKKIFLAIISQGSFGFIRSLFLLCPFSLPLPLSLSLCIYRENMHTGILVH